MRVDSAISGQFVLTLPLVVLILARALDGLTGGNVSVANAYLADVTTEKERAPAFGRRAVSSNLGVVLGPAIAGGATNIQLSIIGERGYGLPRDLRPSA